MAANEVCITEYADMVSTIRGAAQVPQDPPVTTPQILALGGSTVQSAAFNAATKYIRIAVSGIDARILNNTTNPSASATLDERWIAGTTEFRGVTAGNKLAVIAAT